MNEIKEKKDTILGAIRSLVNEENALAPFKDEIKLARDNKISYRGIVNVLKSAGVNTSRYLVEQFCIQELGETRKKKKKKSIRKAGPTQTQKSKALAPKLERALEPKKAITSNNPSFRVAGDDL